MPIAALLPVAISFEVSDDGVGLSDEVAGVGTAAVFVRGVDDWVVIPVLSEVEPVVILAIGVVVDVSESGSSCLLVMLK